MGQFPDHSPRSRRSRPDSRQGSGPDAQERKDRPRCRVCEEAFDTLLLTVRVRQGRAHALCAGLDALGLGQLARTSGRLK
ncbi:hypothetical protein [Lyngbya confervoides]|uniref:Uncharacterized protein n=1 Tax=Lyngbya confervoides BDU141951 TaxID=1574623 RepID=A0ABD4SYX2_9CYAN|nr:hypothetical protein [Lyngbya confervoides]MCM1981666.1 hypothetical protein [Lyngbya confervoides BDU141951]